MNALPRRSVLITGAAGGIGRALVSQFVAAGYDVIATDRLESPVDLECRVYIQADLAQLVRDTAYADRFLAEVRKETCPGQLHALINNAAIQILGGVNTLSREDWHISLDVNLLAPFILTQALLPELEAGQGAVLNISSIHATLTKKRFVAYAASKAALSGMTRAMAVDLGDRIRINAIEPAAIHTEMLADGFRDNPRGLVELGSHHPTGYIGQPEEVARLALMLCNGDLPFVNGACIALDGGIRSRLHDPD
jgi:NAD(P)-dependent dehydrogenase (short-subunit alcohol dehydrogenase family)